ncbi:uncharacterized protein LOC141898894 [Tubulanus polymorphus]|uniref:uncharacterized protein LOC141898894 n=1 Tax=Tubulanus polymorphus TaxID=672921 RepID=UPI003DA55BB8
MSAAEIRKRVVTLIVLSSILPGSLSLLFLQVKPEALVLSVENERYHGGSSYVRENSNLRLTCNLTSKYHGSSTSQDLILLHNDNNLTDKLIHVDNNSVLYEKANVTSRDAGFYFCKISNERTVQPITRDIRIDGKLVLQNLDCEVKNYDSMQCFINTSTTTTNCTLSYNWSPKLFQWTECPLNKNWCLLDSVYTQTGVYHFKVKCGNLFETVSENYSYNPSDIAVLRNVSDIQVNTISPTVAIVSWKPVLRYKPDIKVKYRIRYECPWDIIDDGGKVPLETEGTNVHLSNLYPNGRYEIEIIAIVVNGHLDGRPALHSFQMPPDIPGKNPTIVGYYYFSAGANLGSMTVFFEPPHIREIHAPIHQYVVNVSTHGSMLLASDKTSFTISQLRVDKSYTVLIELQNKVGRNDSLQPSSFFIQTANPKSLQTIGFYAEAVSRSAQRVHLHWNHMCCGHTDAFYIYWCQGSLNTKQCSGVMHYKAISADRSSDTIHISDEYDKHLFGISQETRGLLSGIVWSDCNYIIGQVPQKKPDVQLKGDDHAIMINVFKYTCEESKGRVKDYLIEYKENASEESRDPVRVPADHSGGLTYQLGNLRPKTNYHLKVIPLVSDNDRNLDCSYEGTERTTGITDIEIGLIACGAVVFLVMLTSFGIWGKKCVEKRLIDDKFISMPEPDGDDVSIEDGEATNHGTHSISSTNMYKKIALVLDNEGMMTRNEYSNNDTGVSTLSESSRQGDQTSSSVIPVEDIREDNEIGRIEEPIPQWNLNGYACRTNRDLTDAHSPIDAADEGCSNSAATSFTSSVDSSNSSTSGSATEEQPAINFSNHNRTEDSSGLGSGSDASAASSIGKEIMNDVAIHPENLWMQNLNTNNNDATSNSTSVESVPVVTLDIGTDSSGNAIQLCLPVHLNQENESKL